MKRSRVKRMVSLVVGFAAAGGSMLLAPAAAGAAGSSYSGAQYQITWSLNCTNRSAACATDPNIGGLGGFWGWVALMPSSTPGTGLDNGQETVCGHSYVPGAAPGGAGHASFDSTWISFNSPTPVGPVVDPNGNYLVINDPFGLFPVPATYGHYTVSFEGATGQITVAP